MNSCEKLAQEYTGQQIDLFAMPSLWQEIFREIGEVRTGRMCAAAAVSNLGRDANWTGHPFAALNLYAFGRFSWDPFSDPEQVISEWIMLTYDMDAVQSRQLLEVLTRSRGAYEKYTSTLGLCWMMNPGDHYGPNPWGSGITYAEAKGLNLQEIIQDTLAFCPVADA